MIDCEMNGMSIESPVHELGSWCRAVLGRLDPLSNSVITSIWPWCPPRVITQEQAEPWKHWGLPDGNCRHNGRNTIRKWIFLLGIMKA